MSHPIDTREVMEQLTDAGVPPEQAKAHTLVLMDSLQNQRAEILSHACSKQDLREALEPIHQSITELVRTTARLEATLVSVDAKIERTDAKIDSTVGKLKGEWITWLLAFGLLHTALVGSVLLRLVP